MMRVPLLAIVLSGCLSTVGGAFDHEPEELAARASPAAQALITQALTGLDPARRADYHAHVVGLGQGGSGAFVHPHMHAWLRHPLRFLRFAVYKSAAGIRDEGDADAQYFDRLRRLARHAPIPGRHVLLAFDQYHDAAGEPVPEHTEFYTPNAYVFSLAARDPDLFAPAMSVHPYRADALAELDRWADAGGRILKWLPNAMGIDPADPRLSPFYDRMRERGVALLTHAGEEKAVEAEAAQALGNPLLLRAPLRRGVKVIVAHCASLGESVDLDDPARRPARNVDLWLRLMEEPAWRGLLFGEISGVTLFNRFAGIVPLLLARPELHDRLVDGSDYPLPAVNIVYRTRALAAAGLLTDAERDALNEVYEYNPLLFDFVLKRTLHGPRGERLAARIFEEHALLPLR